MAARRQYSRCMSVTCASKPLSPQASRISAITTCNARIVANPSNRFILSCDTGLAGCISLHMPQEGAYRSSKSNAVPAFVESFLGTCVKLFAPSCTPCAWYMIFSSSGRGAVTHPTRIPGAST